MHTDLSPSLPVTTNSLLQVGFVDAKAIEKTGLQYYDRCEQNPFADGCVDD